MIALGSTLTPDQPQPKPSRSRITFSTSSRVRLKLPRILMQLKCPNGTWLPMRYKPSPSCLHKGEGLYLIGNQVPLGHFSCIRIRGSFSLTLEEVENVILLLDGLGCGWSGVKVDPSAIILGGQGVPNADRVELVKQR